MAESYKPESKTKSANDQLSSNQNGKVYIKVYWWPLIISLGLSLLLTIILNVVLH